KLNGRGDSGLVARPTLPTKAEITGDTAPSSHHPLPATGEGQHTRLIYSTSTACPAQPDPHQVTASPAFSITLLDQANEYSEPEKTRATKQRPTIKLPRSKPCAVKAPTPACIASNRVEEDVTPVLVTIIRYRRRSKRVIYEGTEDDGAPVLITTSTGQGTHIRWNYAPDVLSSEPKENLPPRITSKKRACLPHRRSRR
ncbi:hypothetical protein DXG01_012837, partial [Tephrocybe rancida]